jgi:hypothetical protein
VLYVTADHGMVNVGPEDWIDVDAIPELRAGVGRGLRTDRTAQFWNS